MATISLPAPPRALAAILEAASDPEVGLEHLARLVSSDPPFAGITLQLANSTRHRGARRTPITDLQQATMRLGVRTVRNYALCHAAQSCAKAAKLKDFDLDAFWEDSLRRAVAAELLAEVVGELEPHEAFTIGLLMELGVVALLMQAPDQVDAWCDIRYAEPSVRLAAERKLFGATHVEVNVQLARDWGLPDGLAMPLIHHHAPEEAPVEFRLASAIAGGAEVMATVLSRDEKRDALARTRRLLGESLDIGADQADAMLEALGQRVHETGEVMGIRVSKQPTLEEILTLANRSLVEANLSYEDLVRRLEAVIAEKEALAAKLDEQNRELERLSTTDTLTRLPNRRQLFSRLTEELHRVGRHGGPLSFLMVDIDHFKSVNDTWGHVFGDEVLQRVAEELKQCGRLNDVVARAGGEEFAALLPETNLQGATVLANRMLVAVARLRMTTPTNEMFQLTVSIGVACIEGPHLAPMSADRVATRLYRVADTALYRSKERGRNRVSKISQVVSWDEG